MTTAAEALRALRVNDLETVREYLEKRSVIESPVVVITDAGRQYAQDKYNGEQRHDE